MKDLICIISTSVAVLVSASLSLSSSASGELLLEVRAQHPGITQPSWNVSKQNELVQSDATSRYKPCRKLVVGVSIGVLHVLSVAHLALLPVALPVYFRLYVQYYFQLQYRY